jgi:hypothetical protein
VIKSSRNVVDESLERIASLAIAASDGNHMNLNSGGNAMTTKAAQAE